MRHINEFFQKLFAGAIDARNLKEELRKQRIADEGENTTTERFFGQIVDGPAFVAPKRIAAGPSYFTTDQMLRYQNRADWQFTHSDIQRFAAYLVEALRRRNIPMYVHTAYRTKKEQDAAFRRGVSNLQWPRAAHCQGMAVDIVHARYHWELTKQEWALIGKIGKDIAKKLNIPIEWGGDWQRPWDPAHWQLEYWDQGTPSMYEDGEPIRHTARKLLSMHRI